MFQIGGVMLNPDYVLIKMLKFISDQKFVNERQLEAQFSISKVNNPLAIKKRISKLFRDGYVRKNAGFDYKRKIDYTISSKGVALLKTVGIDCGEYMGVFTEASYKHIITITDLRIYLEKLFPLDRWRNREDIISNGEYRQLGNEVLCPSATFYHNDLGERWGIEYFLRYDSSVLENFQKYSLAIPRQFQQIIFIFDDEVSARRANMEFDKSFHYPASFISYDEISSSTTTDHPIKPRGLSVAL